MAVRTLDLYDNSLMGIVNSDANVFSKAANTVQIWINRYNTRKALEHLDAFMLEDIGLDEADVQIEIGKPFWIK